MDGWKNNLQKSGGNFFFSAIENQLHITKKNEVFPDNGSCVYLVEF